ncbi:AbrB/MazE/SpoVT family DNA-binding domain-containing protein [Leucothrix arctica]|uniref:AbrB family transcriptional regulator n=1 Tax=Leucothrix arctica TaxID=1481894 RepID=A0A317C576_9GAMM|nr:AbrB/MazE/SpoVT family DNA-binding domain-containing protein [Leucothrix arctica]PWQ93429.1 AbrB family transcriptional regulator [Leucothrix arctica]
MNALISTMTQKGQVTIPKHVRDRLNLVTGDKVEFIVNDRNEVVIKPITRKAMEVAGLLSKYKKAQPVSVEEMNQIVV